MLGKSLYSLTLVVTLSTLLQGCGFLAGAAVDGTTGYLLKDNGYAVRAPITVDTPKPPTDR